MGLQGMVKLQFGSVFLVQVHWNLTAKGKHLGGFYKPGGLKFLEG